jgi:hypothetical protein
MPKCPGCGTKLAGGGRARTIHLAKTSDGRCLKACQEAEEFGSDLRGEFPAGGGTFTGDFFGEEYTEDDFGYISDGTPESGSDSQDDDDDNDYAAAAEVQAGDGWEPRRAVPNDLAPEEDSGMEDIEIPAALPAREMRKIAEDRFHEPPVIVQYPSDHASKEISDERSPSAEEHYSDALGKTTSIYAPFVSKMDWEVARWAKLRGSGSTAFTDLLKIEGVGVCLVHRPEVFLIGIALGFPSSGTIVWELCRAECHY